MEKKEKMRESNDAIHNDIVKEKVERVEEVRNLLSVNNSIVP